MIPYEEFAANLNAVLARLDAACAACGRAPGSVTLLPVTKTHPAEAVRHALRSGLAAVGENRVREASLKKAEIPPGLSWELIGHLQSNKAAEAVATFDRIQSVDSPELAARLGRHAAASGRTLRVLLQANAGADPAKFGADFDGLSGLLDRALATPGLRVEGLMTVAPLDDSPETARRCFDTLRGWRDSLAASRGVGLAELSMGMSGDLEHAVAAGSTVVRVGSALFGAR